MDSEQIVFWCGFATGFLVAPLLGVALLIVGMWRDSRRRPELGYRRDLWD